MAKCNYCGREMLTANGCSYKRVVIKGEHKKTFNRIKVGAPRRLVRKIRWYSGRERYPLWRLWSQNWLLSPLRLRHREVPHLWRSVLEL